MLTSVAKHSTCSSHQVEGVFPIHNHVTLQTKTLEKFSLSLWSSSCHRHNGFWSNGINCFLELINFNCNKLRLAVDFDIELIFLQLYLIIILHFDKFKFSLFFNLLRVYHILCLIYFNLSLNLISFRSSFSICNSETSGLNTAIFSFKL